MSRLFMFYTGDDIIEKSPFIPHLYHSEFPALETVSVTVLIIDPPNALMNMSLMFPD